MSIYIKVGDEVVEVGDWYFDEGRVEALPIPFEDVADAARRAAGRVHAGSVGVDGPPPAPGGMLASMELVRSGIEAYVRRTSPSPHDYRDDLARDVAYKAAMDHHASVSGSPGRWLKLPLAWLSHPENARRVDELLVDAHDHGQRAGGLAKALEEARQVASAHGSDGPCQTDGAGEPNAKD